MAARFALIFGFYLTGAMLYFSLAPLPSQAQTQGGSQLEALDAKILELWAAGKNNESLPLQKRVVELSDKTLGPEHPKSVDRAESLAYSLWLAGRQEEAKSLFVRLAKSRERLLNSKKFESEDAQLEVNKLGQLYEQLGRFGDAETLYRRALAMREKAHGPVHPNVAKALDKLSMLYARQERFAEQEPVLKRQLTILEKTQDATHFADPNLPKELVVNLARTETYNAVNQLAVLYGTLGRYSEMEALAKRNLSKLQKEGASFEILTTVNYQQLGRISVIRGQYAEAVSYFKKAIEIERRIPDENAGCDACNDLAEVYLRQGRYDDAEKAAKTALDINTRIFSDKLPSASSAQLVLAQSYFGRKRYADAESVFSLVAKNIGTFWGPEHASMVSPLVGLAEVKLAQGKPLESYDYAKRATSILIRQIATNAQALTMSSGGQMRPVEFYQQSAFDAHMRAAAELAAQFPERAQALAAETFDIAQRAQHSEAASALSQMAVRFAQGDGVLAQQVRQRQELTVQYRALDKSLIEALIKPDAQRNQAAEDNWRKAREDLVKRIRAIDANLAKDFPQYAALVNPAPLPIQEVQQLLRPGEALVLLAHEALDSLPFRQTAGQTYIWVVTREEARWKASPISTGTLVTEVAALRCGLDESAWHTPERCRKLLGGKSSPDGAGLPFDLVRAHALYTKLFQPFDDLIKDRHILFASSGALTTLPLQVLVTAVPDPALTDAERYAKAAWLGRRQPVTVLPSVTGLKSLRGFAKKSLATNPYAGFGNPLLVGAKGDNRSAWARQDCLTAVVASGQRVAARSVVQAPTLNFFRGGRADLAALRRQEPLPETVDELCQVANALAAPPDSLFLGARATEPTLKSLSTSGALKSRRVLHFATHGLVAGETKAFSVNRAEPALLLTPPETASSEDDGLLTASEVARLEMDADWVILSACNTAASDGSPGAEALSGLASAFLYAGARSLLVSHWYVNSEGAVKLITGAFAELRRDPTIGKAEALRRSIEARIREGGGRAHPSYWAPFAIVGEGG
jgi:CHAT domain-containing protein/tetratricopeptide (TPR) repeat protein